MPTVALAAPVHFVDIVDEVGITWTRTPSETAAVLQAHREASLEEPVPVFETFGFPHRTTGLPGVLLFDYDDDGDIDIYATNGPGTANSLYANQLSDDGSLTFVDVAVAAGVGAASQDSTGVCAGDTDNDGDTDLFVLGRAEANLFFENAGDGTFLERPGAGVGGGARTSTGCSLGDIDADGFIDLVVANAFDFSTLFPVLVEPFENEHNQLYLNNGDGTFDDVSVSSGIQDNVFADPYSGNPGLTWGVAMVDIDMDGDIDIQFADDQGGVLPAAAGGVDRGLVHLFMNDGTGFFTDDPIDDVPFASGAWMGLAYGDYDCDGAMDMYVANLGDYDPVTLSALQGIEFPYILGQNATRPFMGVGDGTFTDPGVVGTSLHSTGFSWGIVTFDMDNDGDQDLSYNGGLDMDIVAVHSNPGIVLENVGCGQDFVYRLDALDGEYTRRTVQGMARGDLNNDGFPDLVTVANHVAPEPIPYVPGFASHDTVLDDHDFFIPIFAPADPGTLVWTGVDFGEGTMTVEINSADSGNSWISVELLGTRGLIPGGAVNREGIGAIVEVTPKHGASVLSPVVAGESYVSQNALVQTFGLGHASKATVDVRWPGGVRNRWSGVKKRTARVFPEIPCSYDDPGLDEDAFEDCVEDAVEALVDLGILDEEGADDLLDGMDEAWEDAHG